MIRNPTKQTLAKYGLTLAEWIGILNEQGCVCPICGKQPPSGRMVTDHEHVRGFKKLLPAERKRFVRGICCWTCNRYFLARGMDCDKAQALFAYLERYDRKKP